MFSAAIEYSCFMKCGTAYEWNTCSYCLFPTNVPPSVSRGSLWFVKVGDCHYCVPYSMAGKLCV